MQEQHIKEMTDVGILAGPEGPGDRSKKWGPKIPTFWVSRVPRGRPDPQNQSFPPPGKVLFYYFRACCCAALLALLGVMAPGAHAAGGSEPRRHRRLGAGRVEAAAHRRDPARARLWPPQGCIFLEIGEPRHRLKGREGGPGERPKGTREPGWQFSMATRRRRMSNFTRDVSARARRKMLVDAGVGAGVSPAP